MKIVAWSFASALVLAVGCGSSGDPAPGTEAPKLETDVIGFPLGDASVPCGTGTCPAGERCCSNCGAGICVRPGGRCPEIACRVN